jgi:hypothetical protein
MIFSSCTKRNTGMYINVNSQYWQRIMKRFMSILFQCSFLLILHCYFLGRFIPSPSIPSEFAMMVQVMNY